MLAQAPEPPEEGVATVSSPAAPSFAWLPGGVPGGARARVLDWQALLEALAAGGFLDGQGEDHDAALAEKLAAEQDGRIGPPMPPAQVAGLAMEHMLPGPAMAGWLGEAVADITSLDEYSLVGAMTSARQLTSWAQAAELAAVAQLTSSCAAADPDVGLHPDGRPIRVTRDAVGQVALALRLSDYGAGGLIHLAVTLGWRLRATAAALADGRIDLYRARLIVEATSVLSEDAARAVEAKVLPGAGELAQAQLRAKLRQAVIAVDPQGADQRRTDAERHASVSLYPDPDGTATLTGTKLPQAQAAAAMAKITAIAKAMKAAGWAGGLDLLRSVVMLHLLLGTLPYIPPPDGGQPDRPPPGGGGQPPNRARDGESEPPHRPAPGNEAPPAPPQGEPPAPLRDEDAPPAPPRDEDAPPAPPRDEDAPPDDGLDAGGGDARSEDRCFEDEDDGDQAASGPVPPWSDLGTILPALPRLASQPDGRPPPGLLDVTLPWATLAGLPDGGPGVLGRIGPITPVQARELAQAAEHDAAAQWRIVITDPAGRAIAVTRLRRCTARSARAGPSPPPKPSRTGLIGRVTLTISQDLITQRLKQRSGPLSRLAAAALNAAARVLQRALAQAEADAVAGGCAHTGESAAYRPPARVREFVVARDVTCRFLTCRQPAWRADLDHTIPYDQGGRSCTCNLGGRCRKHHILKQHRRWSLEQNERGEFIWSTPTGRRYVARPDGYQL